MKHSLYIEVKVKQQRVSPKHLQRDVKNKCKNKVFQRNHIQQRKVRLEKEKQLSIETKNEKDMSPFSFLRKSILLIVDVKKSY